MLLKSQMHNYQRAAAEHVIEKPAAGLFMEMGLGKTVSALTAMDELMYELLEVGRALVVAPRRVIESVWMQEADKWEHLGRLTFSLVHGPIKKRRRALAETADIYLVSRDNVPWLCGQYGGLTLPFDMLVVDESSSFKNPDSVRFKALRQVQPSFKRVLILTGTPAPNGLRDLWSQLYLLDRGARLGKFYTQYTRTYFSVANPFVPKEQFTYELQDEAAEAEIYDRIGDIVLSMKSEDYLELPGIVDNRVELALTPKLAKKYSDFERDLVLELFEDTDAAAEIPAVNAAVLANKLLQFSGGAIYDEARQVHEIHDIKIKAAVEIVEAANGAPVLIAWAYRHERDRLLKALEKYGPRTLDDENTIEDWNLGLVRVLLMHPASGGHGLNIQSGGNNLLWYSPTWSLELYQQFNARLNRQGQDNVVVRHGLTMSGTMDERVAAALRGKATGQEALMQAVKAVVNKYR